MSILSPRAPVNTPRQAKHKTRTLLASITGVFYLVFRYSEGFSGEIGPIDCMQTHNSFREPHTGDTCSGRSSSCPLIGHFSTCTQIRLIKEGSLFRSPAPRGSDRGCLVWRSHFKTFQHLPSRNNAKHVIYNTHTHTQKKRQKKSCSLLKCCTPIHLLSEWA